MSLISKLWVFFFFLLIGKFLSVSKYTVQILLKITVINRHKTFAEIKEDLKNSTAGSGTSVGSCPVGRALSQ